MAQDRVWADPDRKTAPKDKTNLADLKKALGLTFVKKLREHWGQDRYLTERAKPDSGVSKLEDIETNIAVHAFAERNGLNIETAQVMAGELADVVHDHPVLQKAFGWDNDELQSRARNIGRTVEDYVAGKVAVGRTATPS